MASRRTTQGGDYDLSDPVNGFVDIVRRVVLQPRAFFAGLPRQGSFLGPLVFALICIEVSVFLVGLLTFLDVPGGGDLAVRRQARPGLPGVLGGAGGGPHSGSRGSVLDGACDARVGHLGGGIGALRVRGDLPSRLLLLGDEPSGLVAVHRVDLLFVPPLPGHRGDPRDALDEHGQGAPGGAAAGHPDTGIGRGGGRRIGHLVLQGRLIKVGMLD
jgi:hypothetical protein